MSVLIRLSRNVCSKCEYSWVRQCSFTSKIDHVYDDAIPWKSNREFADYLCDNLVYDNYDLVVFNKPYGISFSKSGQEWKKDEKESSPSTVLRHKSLRADRADVQETNAGFLEGDRLNLFDAMPFIQKEVGGESPLVPVRVPEKYTSGVAIFCRTAKAEKRVRKSWLRVKSFKLPAESYLAVVSGMPTKESVKNFRIGVTLDAAKTSKQKKAILTTEYSNNSVLRSEVKVSPVNSNILATRPDQLATLINVAANVKSWHFVRLFLAAHLLSPVLGDHMFGSRVKTVMGIPLPVDHWHSFASCPQKLNSELLTLLDLKPGSEKYIPTMLHLSSITLPGFLNRSEALKITAPPPSYFLWTCARLRLSIPEHESHNYSEAEQILRCKAGY